MAKTKQNRKTMFNNLNGNLPETRRKKISKINKHRIWMYFRTNLFAGQNQIDN